MQGDCEVRVEVSEQPEGLRGEEVWVRVLSNTVVDWPEVKQQLTAEQRELLAGASVKPVGYYPDSRTQAERSADGHKYEDYFIFSVRSSA